MRSALTGSVVLPVSLDVLILFLVLLIAVVILFVFVMQQKTQIRDLEKRLRKLSRGKTGTSLESEIIHLFEANDILTESVHKAQKELAKQRRELDTSFRKVGLIKYDAFNQMGGKLSFALALVNEESNGIILNSVHSQDGNYIYVKEVEDGKCDLELGTEEQQALDRALACE